MKHLRTRYLFAGDVLDAYDKIKKTRIDRRETPFESSAFILTTESGKTAAKAKNHLMTLIRKRLGDETMD